MRFMPILAFSIFSLYSGLLLAQNKDSPIIIDVPKELYNRLGLPSGVVTNEKCSNRTGCTRYCPKRPQCNSYYEFHNLVVANISDIKYEEPDPDSIPSYREDERKTVVNCFKKDSWSWEETINYKSTQTVIAFKPPDYPQIIREG